MPKGKYDCQRLGDRRREGLNRKGGVGTAWSHNTGDPVIPPHVVAEERYPDVDIVELTSQ